MKVKKVFIKISLFALFLLPTMLVSAQTTVTAPPGTTTTATTVVVTVSYNAATSTTVACTQALCNYNILRINGACPATIVGSTGWTAVASGINPLTYTDTTVLPSTEYSYITYAVLISDSTISTPSNCATVTTSASPLVPSPATVGVVGH